MSNKQYKSGAFAAIHESMESLHRIGSVDKKTMRHFDEMCIESVEMMQPHEIKALREQEGVSQPIFALYLNVSRNTVSDWERGVKKPSGPALRLLQIVQARGVDDLLPSPITQSEYDVEERIEDVTVLQSIQADLREIRYQVRSNSEDLRKLSITPT